MKNQIFTLADIQPKDTSDIEWQVLSDLMSDDDLLPEVVSTINQDFFSSDGRKALWNAIVTEFNKGTPVAGYVAFAQMPKEVQTEFNAYTERSVRSVNSISTKDEAVSHIAVLRSAAARRRAYNAGLALHQISTGNDSESDVYSRAVEAVQNIEDKSVREE